MFQNCLKPSIQDPNKQTISPPSFPPNGSFVRGSALHLPYLFPFTSFFLTNLIVAFQVGRRDLISSWDLEQDSSER